MKMNSMKKKMVILVSISYSTNISIYYCIVLDYEISTNNELDDEEEYEGYLSI
jgi:hypothetical protein